MVISVSGILKKEIGAANQIAPDTVEEELWSHSSHSCYLCEGELNRASDAIEVDHKVPQAEGGGHEFGNLRLAHLSCNRFKKNNNSDLVAPYLRLKRFYEENKSILTFEKAQVYFKQSGEAVFIDVGADSATFEMPSGKKAKVPVFKEKLDGKSVSYCFVDLSLSCLRNDKDVQPRDVKINHLWAIAQDLRINPLHEQPACRWDGKNLLIFDGQHKALAKALNGQFNATYKVYLDLNRADATVLVNSVQAKIKKLPLSPFELAAKLTDELRDALVVYEADVGPDAVSEEGFVKSLDPKDRGRAKSAIEAHRIDAIMKSTDLEMIEIVETKGQVIKGALSVKETLFQNKVLKSLLYARPLPSSYVGEGVRKAREREVVNIVKILNIFYELGFTPAKTSGVDEDRERARRLNTQASWSYVCDILRQIAMHRVVTSSNDVVFLEKDISEEQWKLISEDIGRLVDHPIWRADLKQSLKTKAVGDAMSKNQGAELAFKNVGLTNGYCVKADVLSAGALND